MDHPQHNSTVDLPESLRQKFADLQRRLWKMETVAAVSGALIGSGLCYLVLFFSDRLWDSPVWLRTIMALAGLACFIFTSYQWTKNWVFKRRDLRALANLTQKKFRRLGDRLLGIVELSTEQKHAPNFSPELYRAAIQQVATEAEKFDFREAVEVRLTKKLMVAASGLLGILLLLGIFFPAASWNVLTRWLAPGATIPRYTLVNIENLPTKLIVPHGENFSLSADVRYRSFWKPSRATAQFQKHTRLESPVQKNKAVFQIPARLQNDILKIKIGDAQKEILIAPNYRPSLEQLSATIQWPDYLKYPLTNQIVQNGTLHLLEGSRVVFHGKISRALRSGQIQIADKNFAPLKIEGDEFSTDFLKREGNFKIAFSWRDNLGLSNSTPWTLAVQSQKDAPPSPTLPELPRDAVMLFSDVLKIKTEARDDFGVRDLGLTWNSASGESQGAASEIKVQTSTPREKNFEKVFQWNPAVFGIAADSSVELQAFASDFFPGRDRAESAVYRIHILGNEQHAELVRQQLESLLTRVEEVSRLEEKILQKTDELKTDKKLSATEMAEKIGAVNQDQIANAKQLAELAQEGMKALREALKNPTFTEEALQKWAKNLREMKQLSQQEMKQASDNLKSAQQNASQSEAKEKNLADAQKQEEQILQALEKMQNKVNQGLDDLQALTLAQRLRKVGSSENEIGEQLQKVFAETIGLLPSELPQKLQKLNTTLAGQQDQAQKESVLLQGEINRFYERTQKTNYDAVSQEIKETRTAEELDRLRGLIADNVAMEATKHLTNWSARFAAWADKLEPQDSSSANGQAGAGGEKPEDMTQQLIALLRLREKEITLRQQTRLLDEQKEEHFKERAGSLFSTQKKLTEDLAKMEKENRLAILARPFGETRQAMEEAQLLLGKPQTDKITAQAQVKTIELLSDMINLINEQAQRIPPSSSSGN
ncbi:MAG: hypothetical protein M3Y82_11925, partial [Verrucomicrobiota bacterium]|nr:hypothetical protein [Verrucomicrobiota bacterium]